MVMDYPGFFLLPRLPLGAWRPLLKIANIYHSSKKISLIISTTLRSTLLTFLLVGEETEAQAG